MSTEQNDQAEDAPHRMTAAEAREKAKQKAEFILSRAYGLFRAPDAEWLQIRDEKTNIPSIILGYVAPLAAIPHVCGLIGNLVFGNRVVNEYGTTVIRATPDTIVATVISYVVVVLLVFLLGILINAIAENFDGDRNEIASQKVAAYSMTPAFLSGIFSLWPALWWLSLIAVGYSAYLLYRGLPPLMKAPEDRALGYASMVGIAGIVAFVLVFALTSCVT